jgi:tape measure domain-containing protein
MATLANLLVRIAANTDELTAGLKGSEERLRAFQSAVGGVAHSVKGIFSEMSNTLGALGLQVGILSIGGAAIKLASDFEQTNMAFTQMLGSAEKATAYLGQLRAFAEKTPFEFEDVTRGARRLMAFGFEANNVIPIMRRVGDAVAAMGGSAEQVDRVVTALGQMRAKQKVSAEEMNQLSEAMIPAWEILAKRIGVSVPEAMKMAEKGTLDASKAIDGIIEGMGQKFDGMMAKQATTTAGRFSNLMDQLKTMGTDFGTALLPIANFAMSVLGPALTFVARTVSAAWAGLQVVISGIVLRVGMSVQSLFELMAKLPGSTGESFQKAAANVTAFNDATKKTLDGAMKTMLDGTVKQSAAYDDQYKKIKGLGGAHAESAEHVKKVSKAWDDAAKRAEEYGEFWEKISVRNLESVAGLVRSVTQLGDTYKKAHDAMTAAAKQQLEVVWQLNDAQQTAMNAASMDRINAEQATRRGEKAMKDLGLGTVKASKDSSKALQEVSTIVNDLSRNIAQAIIHWTGFADVVKKTAVSIGESILRNIINRLIEASGIIPKLTNLFIDLANKILRALNLSVQLSKVPVPSGGGGNNPANIPISYPGGGAPMPTGGGGAGGAGSAGGAMGAVNMITGIATAISSLVGNFQMYAMNKSLDLIEHEVRYSQIHLLHLLQNANEFWPWMKFAHDRLATATTQGMPIYNAAGDAGLRVIGAMGGGASTTVNVSGGMFLGNGGIGELADLMIREMRARGAKI